MSKRKQLTSKQRLFIAEYLKDKNGTRAAIAAGYGERGAGTEAERQLRKADVKSAVEAGLAKQLSKIEITAEKIAQNLADIAFHTPTASLKDRIRASELLGKHAKMFVDRFEQHTIVNAAVTTDPEFTKEQYEEAKKKFDEEFK